MADYTFSDPAQLTEFLENSPLYIATNTTLWGNPVSTPLTPFYYEDSTNTVNFGYGINLKTVAGDDQLQTEMDNILSALPDPVTISAPQWDILKESGLEGSSTSAGLQSITADLNSVAEGQTVPVIQSAADTLTKFV